MARAALGWGVRDLAEKAGVAANTISRFENGADALGETLAKVERVLIDAGLEFISENGGGDGIRFRRRRNERGNSDDPV
ncbi:MAG TPA: helix-turn-helix transcriptional regulator [Rhodospirillaceae bacterium]|jgi:transcriptional regulator with XRE-family HTH domain|nr:helix-turn-helix transcriptional regulator [Rhodospirillaceae bacterium]